MVVKIIKDTINALLKNNDLISSKLVSLLKFYITILDFVMEFEPDEYDCFVMWFQKYGYQYLHDFLDIVQKYDTNIEKLIAILDYYNFYLQDTIENNDVCEMLDWLYSLFVAIKNRILEFCS